MSEHPLPSLSTLATTQPRVAGFLAQAFQARSLAHAYIFSGHNLSQLYETALMLGQILNCRQKPSPEAACGECPDCRWVAENVHPEVITVSRMSHLSEKMLKDWERNRARQPHKQISAEQISEVIARLMRVSDRFRVVVFCDFEERGDGAAASVVPPADWRQLPGRQNRTLHLKPLHSAVFHDAPANRLLKSLEEPLPNTLFLFLTDAPQNLLETIVSRCQVLTFATSPGDYQPPALPAEQAAFLEQLLATMAGQRDFYPATEAFRETFLDNDNLTPAQAVVMLQQALGAHLPAVAGDAEAFRTLRRKLALTEEVRQMLVAGTHTDQTLNHLFLNLAHMG